MSKENEKRKGGCLKYVIFGFLILGLFGALTGDKKDTKSENPSSASTAATSKTRIIATPRATYTPIPTQTPVPDIVTGFGDKKGKDIVNDLADLMGFWPEKRKVNMVGYSYTQWVTGDKTDYNVYNYMFNTDENDNMTYAQFMIAPRDTINYFSKAVSLFFSHDDAQKIDALIAAHKEKGEEKFTFADMVITHDRNDANVMLLIEKK